METGNTVIKALYFSTGHRDYAIPIPVIKEIIRMVEIAPVSELPAFVRGIINLRGQIVPVVDFLQRAGAGITQANSRSRIIILKIRQMLIGVLVDQVHEVIEVDSAAVSQNIRPEVVLQSRYISGMFVHNNHWITLIDIERLLTDQEIELLERTGAHA